MPCQLVRFCPQGHVAAPVKPTPQVADQASKHGRKSSVTKWYHESWDKKNNEKVTEFLDALSFYGQSAAEGESSSPTASLLSSAPASTSRAASTRTMTSPDRKGAPPPRRPPAPDDEYSVHAQNESCLQIQYC